MVTKNDEKLSMIRNIVIVLLLSGSAYAQVVFSSVEDAWKYAEEHSINIIIAKHELNKAGYNKLQTYTTMLPQLTASGSYTDNMTLATTLIPAQIFGGPPGTYTAVQFGQKFIYSGALNAQMDLLNLQNWFNAQMAKNAQQLSRDSLANIRKSIYQQIATQYYSYMLMQEAARIANVSMSIADSVLQSTQNKLKEGSASEVSENTAKINFERAQQGYITAQSQMMTAANNLKILMNLSLKDSISITSMLDTRQPEEVADGFSEDPSIRLAYTRSMLSLSQYRGAKSAFLPTVSILYNKSFQQNDNLFRPFESGGPAWFPAEYWSLRAIFPLFTSGNRYFQLRKNKIAYEESEILLDAAKKQSELNDENLKLAYRRALSVYNNAGDVMKLSFSNYIHASNRYEAGVASLDERLNAFSDYINYQNQYLNSLSDLFVQLYQLKIRKQTF